VEVIAFPRESYYITFPRGSYYGPIWWQYVPIWQHHVPTRQVLSAHVKVITFPRKSIMFERVSYYVTAWSHTCTSVTYAGRNTMADKGQTHMKYFYKCGVLNWGLLVGWYIF